MPAKSRISGDRAYKLKRKYISIISDIYSRAIHFKLTSDDINDAVQKEVRQTEEWNRVPDHVRTYVEGYLEAKRAELYRYHIVWVLYCDNILMTSKDVDGLTKQEAAETHSAEHKSPWSRIDGSNSRHVWADKDGVPMYDKPFDRRFLAK